MTRTRVLSISDDLSLPLDVVTQTIAIVAKRRAGKSFLARRLVEQLHKANQQVVVVDPKGDWWGLLSSRDGGGPGLPFIIVGGERGHVPLEPSGGEVVAKLVVEERVSVLIDTSLLRKHEEATFMVGFLEAFYRLKAREQYRTPVMLVVDEADKIAPQNTGKGASGGNVERMLGALDDVVRRGGQRGMGCCVITQRTAVLSKDVLTQSQILIALRTIAPQDLKAMHAWIDVHGSDEQRKTLMASLPSLPIGDAWVWSPGWPTDSGIFKRIRTAPIETFDSGATPRPGEKRAEPKRAADIDIEAVRRQMAETIERAKADDPRELRKLLAEKDTQIRALEKRRPDVVTVLCTDQNDIQDLRERAARLHEFADDLRRSADAMAARNVAKNKPASASASASAPAPAPAPAPKYQLEARPGGRLGVTRAAADSDVGRGGLRRMLIALAQRPKGLTNRQLGLRAGLSSQSGTFSTYLGRARSQGWIEDSGELRSITQAGIAALGDYEPLPTGQALQEYWLAELGAGGQARMLRALCEAYPKALSNDELGALAEISSSSGTFSTYLGRLRGLELVEKHNGGTRASEELF